MTSAADATTASSSLQHSTLCLACRSIFTAQTVRNESGEVAHHGLEDLAARATKGCHLCLTVYMSIDPDAYKNFRRIATSDTLGHALLSPIARDQARLKFRYVTADRADAVSSISATSAKTSLSLKQPDSLMVELILMNPKQAVEPGVRTIDVKSVNTSSPESFQIARKWIDDCSMGHMKCSVSDQGSIWKPKHLLDVTVRDSGGKPGLKLVDGMFVDPLAEYVTLSHCWGRSKPIRLHKSTLPALRQGVAVSNLPKTLGEAAIATERLGYRYLWIDALCIMHDNEQEVLQEICQMHKVYGEATLNLAAAASRDDASGLFYSRNVAALQPCIVSVKGVGIEDGIYKCLRSTIWHDLVDSSPLNRRAWAFQERCLAKRTLFFTRNELLWECQQMCCSEVFPQGLPASFSGGPLGDDKKSFNKRMHHQRHGNWNQIISQYSQGRLTYNSDKLLAMSGLVRQYMARNRLKEEEYVAGLWRPQLPYALLWHAEKGRRPTQYRAPTWSWASLDGELVYPETVQTGKETSIEIIDIQLKTKIDLLGQVESARLKIRGFMARGLLRRTREYWGRTPCVIDCGPTQIEIIKASFDDKLLKLSEANDMLKETLEIYLLPVIDNIDRVEGLLLSATLKKGDFRRIGVFEVTRNDPVNWDKFRAVMKGDPDMINYEERLDHTNGYWFASDYTYTINLI